MKEDIFYFISLYFISFKHNFHNVSEFKMLCFLPNQKTYIMTRFRLEIQNRIEYEPLSWTCWTTIFKYIGYRFVISKNIITCHNVLGETQLLIKICIELKQIEGKKIAPKYKRIKLHKIDYGNSENLLW